MANASPVAAAAIWLDVWERSAGAAPASRATALLAPCIDAAASGALTLGERDALLLDLRKQLFGSHLHSTAGCPQCQERCEWECEIDAMRAAGAASSGEPLELIDDGWKIRMRLLTAADLDVVAHCADEPSATGILLSRCVLEARHDGEIVDVAHLPGSWVERISAALAAADPQAATSVAVTCPACAHAWEAEFDIGAYLWTELDAWALRTLADVHELASRYGWSEPEILALSPTRRARYLSMVAL